MKKIQAQLQIIAMKNKKILQIIHKGFLCVFLRFSFFKSIFIELFRFFFIRQ